jgi:hypothetical protein
MWYNDIMTALTPYTLLDLSRTLARLLAQTQQPDMPVEIDGIVPHVTIPLEDVEVVDGKVVLS